VLKTAKDLVENAKSLVAGAASNQEHLMSAANTVTETIARMSNCVKLGAAALGSHQPDAQVSSFPCTVHHPRPLHRSSVVIGKFLVRLSAQCDVFLCKMWKLHFRR